ncbi:MAG TPA: tetratricopeptide repeat protein [Acidobacteriota bacterium]|nr:tetratricopeptide repeat protein [Acidobacteriota bacterium]
MTKSDRNPKTPPPQPPRNRTLLVIALAAAAVIAAFILWANMEPPPPMSPGDPDAQPTIPETAMQDLMNQIAHVREMIGDDTTDFPALASLGNLYFDANMYEEAIVWYKKALRIQPDDLSVLTDMAIMYRSLHKHDTAVVILRNVVALDSTWQQAWFNLGVIYGFDLKEYEAAIEAWTRYLALDPNTEYAAQVRQEIARLRKELGIDTPGR